MSVLATPKAKKVGDNRLELDAKGLFLPDVSRAYTKMLSDRRMHAA